MTDVKIICRNPGPRVASIAEGSSTQVGFPGRLQLQDFIERNTLHTEGFSNPAISYLAIYNIDTCPNALV